MDEARAVMKEALSESHRAESEKAVEVAQDVASLVAGAVGKLKCCSCCCNKHYVLRLGRSKNSAMPTKMETGF
jgi:hypothetical protein